MSANTKVRIEGSKNLMDAALKHNVRKVIAQSIAFTYEPGEGLATEETPLDYNSTGDRKITVDGVEGLEKLHVLMNMWYYVSVGYMGLELGTVKMV